ncbi:MAG: transporter [Verrucomicrobiota bacterium]
MKQFINQVTGFLLLALMTQVSPLMAHGKKDPGELQENKEKLNRDALLWDGGRPDGHAPIGVMGDHTHNRGEWMFSYRYMRMHMEQNYDGDSVVDSRSFVANPPMGVAPGGGRYLVAPTDMETEVHMWGAMYGLTDHVTLTAMLPYIHRSMNHVRFDGLNFKTTAEGIGDLKLASLIKVLDQNQQRVHFTLGITVPTGSITEEDSVPNSPPPLLNAVSRSRRLPYPMQLGSGTVDFTPGLTYLGQNRNISWGAQAGGVIRFYENHEGYKLGDEFNGTAWAAYRWMDWFSTSFRLAGKVWTDVDGRDSSIGTPLPAAAAGNNAVVVPTADPEQRGGSRIDVAWGVNFYIPAGFLENNRIAAEFSIPVYQNLDGPQLGSDWMFTTGWQWSF